MVGVLLILEKDHTQSLFCGEMYGQNSVDASQKLEIKAIH